MRWICFLVSTNFLHNRLGSKSRPSSATTLVIDTDHPTSPAGASRPFRSQSKWCVAAERYKSPRTRSKSASGRGSLFSSRTNSPVSGSLAYSRSARLSPTLQPTVVTIPENRPECRMHTCRETTSFMARAPRAKSVPQRHPGCENRILTHSGGGRKLEGGAEN